MNINKCQKGKRVERSVANWLKANSFASARRTEQYAGNSEEGDSDVIVPVELPTWHIESKGTKLAKLTQGQINKWLLQVESDCKLNKIPVIINTANRKEEIAILPMATFQALCSTLGNMFNIQCEIGTSITPSEIFTNNKKERKLRRFILGGDLAKNLLNFDALCFVTSEEPYRVCVIIEGLTWQELAKNYEARVKASLVPNELLKSINDIASP